MNKLIDMYNNYSELGETYKLLGDYSPKGIANYNEEELIQHFLYIYSHLGLSAIEILSIEKLKENLNYEIKNLKNYNKLCNDKKWWCLSLLYLKIGTKYHGLNFFTSVISTLINKANNLSLNELSKYCNIMNDCISNIIGFELRIRPSKDNNKSTYISEAYLSLTSNTSNIISIFKEFLPLESMLNDEVQKDQQLLTAIGCKFELWDIIFDIFVGQVLVSLDSQLFCIEDINTYENAVESALLNLTSRNEFIPLNLNIASKKIAKFLE